MEPATLTEQHKATLEQISIDLMAAWKNRDSNILNNILHENFCFVNDTIKDYWVNKEQWMEWLLKKFELITFQYDFQKMELSSGSTMALVVSKLSTLTKPNYTGAQRLYLNTDIWVRPDDKSTWKLIMRQPVSSSFL